MQINKWRCIVRETVVEWRLSQNQQGSLRRSCDSLNVHKWRIAEAWFQASDAVACQELLIWKPMQCLYKNSCFMSCALRTNKGEICLDRALFENCWPWLNDELTSARSIWTKGYYWGFVLINNLCCMTWLACKPDDLTLARLVILLITCAVVYYTYKAHWIILLHVTAPVVIL